MPRPTTPEGSRPPPWPQPLRLAAATALAGLTACSMVPLQPDLDARAPELVGFGQSDLDITTRSPAARRWFNAGVLQAYAFNEQEAVRMFKAGLAQDPRCALCAWGVAWQLGPTINDTGRESAAEAGRYADLAVRHAATATPREQALIAAMALRYGHDSEKAARDAAPLLAERCGPGRGGQRADPLDLAYADRLHDLLARWPDDPLLLTLYAEAEMVATTEDWWQAGTGRPAGRIGEVAERLEAALQRHPQHTGLNHYLIHAVDAPGVVQRATAAADRLGALAPAAPHLVHMPSHTYLLTGRYADATRVNQAAVTAELQLFEVQKAQGFTVSKDWRDHDQSFLSYAALMEGRGDLALATAREVAGRAEGKSPFAEYHRALPVLALLRLQRWDALLAEPLPSGDRGMAQLLGQHARGVALARSGRAAEAAAALAASQVALKQLEPTFSKPDDFDRMLIDGLRATVLRLRAEIALAEGRPADAVALQSQAVTLAHRIDAGDPPMLASGNLQALAEMQMGAGQPAAAEASYRADLAAWPGSGWALSGLVRAVRAQGRDPGALRAEAARAWTQADAALQGRLQ